MTRRMDGAVGSAVVLFGGVRSDWHFVFGIKFSSTVKVGTGIWTR